MSDAFFHRLDEARYRASGLTAGPWSPDHQHGGPPAALLARHLAGCQGGGGKRIARATFEILSPIPVAELSVDAEVVRPGRRVDLVQGSLTVDGGAVLLARGWRHATSEIEVPAGARASSPPPGPDHGTRVPFFDVASEEGYHTGMDWRAVEGAFREPGPATLWMRPAVPLVEDEPTTPLDRVVLAADSGNGISAAADPEELLFINTELTVHLHRHPTGDWVGMRSATTFAPDGVGLAASDLYDLDGSIGRSGQALLVQAR